MKEATEKISATGIPTNQAIPTNMAEVTTGAETTDHLDPGMEVITVTVDIEDMAATQEDSDQEEAIQGTIPPDSGIIAVIGSGHIGVIKGVLGFEEGTTGDAEGDTATDIIGDVHTYVDDDTTAAGGTGQQADMKAATVATVPAVTKD